MLLRVSELNLARLPPNTERTVLKSLVELTLGDCQQHIPAYAHKGRAKVPDEFRDEISDGE